MMMVRTGIALGSNLGNRESHLQAAITALRAISKPEEPLLVAPFYETEPRFCPPGSPPFLNTVVEIAHDGGALDLLETLLGIETGLGRVRGPERNAPRLIDLDLLYVGDEILTSEELILPHPRIAERRFVLQPLADIRPELVLPGHIESVCELLERISASQSPLRLFKPGTAPPCC